MSKRRTDEFELTISKDYHKNSSRCKGDEQPCVICGKPCATAPSVWVHHGGGTVVTYERGVWLNENGYSGGDLGWYPIGRDCLKKNPDLKPFVESLEREGAE